MITHRPGRSRVRADPADTADRADASVVRLLAELAPDRVDVHVERLRRSPTSCRPTRRRQLLRVTTTPPSMARRWIRSTLSAAGRFHRYRRTPTSGGVDHGLSPRGDHPSPCVAPGRLRGRGGRMRASSSARWNGDDVIDGSRLQPEDDVDLPDAVRAITGRGCSSAIRGATATPSPSGRPRSSTRSEGSSAMTSAGAPCRRGWRYPLGLQCPDQTRSDQFVVFQSAPQRSRRQR
jgi:hypothetical protein